MVMAEAVPGLEIGGKPQCRVIALAKDQGQVAASLGCTLSRTRTGLPGDEMTCAIPAGRLATRSYAASRGQLRSTPSQSPMPPPTSADSQTPDLGASVGDPAQTATSSRPRSTDLYPTRGRSRRRCS